MFCPKCGSQIPDGSNFCTACGAKLNAPAAEPIAQEPVSVEEPAPIPEPAPVPEPAPEEPQPIPAPIPEPVSQEPAIAPPPYQPAGEQVPPAYQPVQQDPPPYPPVQPVQAGAGAGFVQPKRGGLNKKLIALIGAAAAALIIIIVAVIGISSMLSSSGGDNAYAYLAGGKYGLITNVKKGESLEIASSRSDSTPTGMMNGSLLAFSPDGKYLYYYTKYDPYNNSGSLCRAEYAKLKKDPDKNDKYIETIASNAYLGFRFLDDGTLTYTNSDNTLYWYNGKEPVQLAKNVGVYYTDGAKRLVYTSVNDGDGSMLYAVDLTKPDDKVKIASNISYVTGTDSEGKLDFENIMYFKLEDDGSKTLYCAGFDREGEKIGAGVDSVYTGKDGKFYFIGQSGETLSLYDYVDDPQASADAGITEPKQEDFSVPNYTYDLIAADHPDNLDQSSLYTSCTLPLYWYGESYWNCYSMEEALKKNWRTNGKEIVAATQNFIDRFESTADEDGLILVTPEVEKALKEIAQYGDDKDAGAWLMLCRYKQQDGTTIDYDAYNDAYDKWNEAKGRIAVREQLKSKENEYPLQNLYCYEKGKAAPIVEKLISYQSYVGGIVFVTTDSIQGKMSMSDIGSISDVVDLLSDMEAEDNISVLLLDSGETCTIPDKAAEAIEDAAGDGGYVSLRFTDKEVFLGGTDGGELSAAPITDKTVGSFKLVTDEASILNQKDGKLYYTSGGYQNNSTYYCDIYCYENGESKRLTKDTVMGGNTSLYEDGVILAYTGYREMYGYELTMIDSKGESSIIAENVTQYVRVDKSSLLYISDGDLYSYNGKEKKMVATNVDWLWVRDSMEYDSLAAWNGYRP